MCILVRARGETNPIFGLTERIVRYKCVGVITRLYLVLLRRRHILVFRCGGRRSIMAANTVEGMTVIPAIFSQKEGR